MGRHLKDFVCIFLFISIRHFAPHSYKRLTVRNVWLDKAKHLVGIVGTSRTVTQKEFEWSLEELWKNCELELQPVQRFYRRRIDLHPVRFNMKTLIKERVGQPVQLSFELKDFLSFISCMFFFFLVFLVTLLCWSEQLWKTLPLLITFVWLLVI